MRTEQLSWIRIAEQTSTLDSPASWPSRRRPGGRPRLLSRRRRAAASDVCSMGRTAHPLRHVPGMVRCERRAGSWRRWRSAAGLGADAGKSLRRHGSRSQRVHCRVLSWSRHSARLAAGRAGSLRGQGRSRVQPRCYSSGSEDLQRVGLRAIRGRDASEAAIQPSAHLSESKVGEGRQPPRVRKDRSR